MADAFFNKVSQMLIKRFGKKAMWNDTIDKYGKSAFGAKWKGCNSQDMIVWKSGYQIINTDTSKKRGEHWVAIYITPTKIYVYDSYGRPTQKLLKILTAESKKRGIQIIDSKPDPEQKGSTSEICGQLSLAWLHVAKQLGIRKAITI
jgi:hypothetical protein